VMCHMDVSIQHMTAEPPLEREIKRWAVITVDFRIDPLEREIVEEIMIL
jgi:hypothetical protein